PQPRRRHHDVHPPVGELPEQLRPLPEHLPHRLLDSGPFLGRRLHPHPHDGAVAGRDLPAQGPKAGLPALLQPSGEISRVSSDTRLSTLLRWAGSSASRMVAALWTSLPVTIQSKNPVSSSSSMARARPRRSSRLDP